MDDAIALQDLPAALARCLAIHPPAGPERRQQPDASRLADLYGLMVYERLQELRSVRVDAEVLEVFAALARIGAGRAGQ